jgi:diguanylate cyclase (GGDEF)-like protein/PAS domain S-box-containing protein
MGMCRAIVMLFALAIGTLSAPDARAVIRTHHFEQLASEQGLAQNTVNILLQDRSGFVWIGTQGGLHRYDGYGFQIHTHDPARAESLADSFITALAEDDQGRLWVGTNAQNIGRLDPWSGRVERFQLTGAEGSDARRNSITELLFQPDKGLWIGSRWGVERFDPVTHSRREILRVPVNVERDSGINAMRLDAEGNLWIASGHGLFRVAAGTDQAQRMLPELDYVGALLVGRDARLWLGLANGLGELDGEGKLVRHWPPVSSQGPLPVWDMVEDRNGMLWMAARGHGLIGFQPETGAVVRLRHDAEIPGSLHDDFCISLMVDRAGLLWVGGETQGVAHTQPEGSAFRWVFDSNPASRSPNANNLRTFWEDARGRLWIGSEGGGLARWSREIDDFEYFNDLLARGLGVERSPRDLRIFAIEGGDDEKLFVASNLGVVELDPDAREAVALPVDSDRVDALPERLVRSLLHEPDGTLWLGTYGSGLVRRDPVNGRMQRFRHDPTREDTLSHDMVLAMHRDRGSRLWIGTLDGLNLMHPDGRIQRVMHDAADPFSISGNLVRSIHEDLSGGIWIGTHSGLNRLESELNGVLRFSQFTTQTGLPSATIYGIEEDARGRLWLSTNRGLSRLDPATRHLQAYGLRDGLQGLEFNGGAELRLASGELVFGGLNGLNIFRGESIEDSGFAPPVVLTGLQVGNRRQILDPALRTESLRMEQSERVFAFEFAALDFRAPERNRFAYRLDGFDSDWVDAGGKHDVTYTNLDAGHYVLRVRATNHDGVWSDRILSMDLEIVPPWWASVTAKALYVLAAASVLMMMLAASRRRRQVVLQHRQEIKQREDRLKLALWGSGDEFWDWDVREARIYRIGADQLLGFEAHSSLSAEDWRNRAVHPEDLPLVEKRLDDHIKGRTDFFESEHRIRNAQGEWVWVLSRGKIVESDSATGGPLRIAGTARDVTASRLAERERRIAAEVIRSMSEAVTVTDLEFRFRSINPAFSRTLGYQEDEVIGRDAALLNSTRHTQEQYESMRRALDQSGHWHGEMWQKRKDGEEILCWLELSEVRDAHGQRTHYVGIVSDITERKRTEQELRYLAKFDTLTGLPNRSMLGERLRRALGRAEREGMRVAVVFIDLDRFKLVNDSMGHAIGDQLLVHAGARLKDCVREQDTVARLGGDEFTMVIEDVRHLEDISAIADKVLASFAEAIDVQGHELVITPSIGISVYPDHGRDATQLLRYADTAMYHAKSQGRNNFQYYTVQMEEEQERRVRIESSLRRALDRNEFTLVFQPRLRVAGLTVTGVEALLRWTSVDLGRVGPDEFIPVAEETGLIVPIGDWVIREAVAQLARWRRSGYESLSMSINISMLQLLKGDLVTRLREALQSASMPAECIELELTESVLMANAEQAITTLRRLKALGVSLSIDDFGTGYSSLSYLRRLPIDTLKIDKAFVGDLTVDPDDATITATIIAMAHTLGLRVVAEGVETEEQQAFLCAQQCDEMQGYLLSPPLDSDSCADYLRRHLQPAPEAVR